MVTMKSWSGMHPVGGRRLKIALTLVALLTINVFANGADAATFPGKQSEWHGFRRYDFEVDGKPVLVIAPDKPAEGNPWVWHGEFFGHKPEPDIALLKRGFHIVYMRVPDMLGAPAAVGHWNAFYKELTEKHGLAKKVALVGLSRGGLYCYNWAAANLVFDRQLFLDTLQKTETFLASRQLLAKP